MKQIKIGDLYYFKRVGEGKFKILPIKGEEKKKMKESDYETYKKIKEKRIALERFNASKQQIRSEKEAYSAAKAESFKHSTAGKVLGVLGKVGQGAIKSVQAQKGGKSKGGFKFGLNRDYIKKWP